jgi:hypothetical protein
MARRVGRMVERLERELKPLFGHLNAIGSDASRAVALATAPSGARRQAVHRGHRHIGGPSMPADRRRHSGAAGERP